MGHLGNLYFCQGKYEQALDIFNQALKEDKGNTYFLLYKSKSKVLVKLKKYDEAILNIKEYLKLFPEKNNDKEIQNLIKILTLERELARTPSDYKIIASIADLYYQNEGYEESIDYYKKAIILKPDDPVLYFNLGVVYWKQKKWDDCIKEWEETLKLKPDYEGAKSWLPKAKEKL